MTTTIEHNCTTCGIHEIRTYTDRQFVEYGHDKFMLNNGLLECGNCENGLLACPHCGDTVRTFAEDEYNRAHNGPCPHCGQLVITPVPPITDVCVCRQCSTPYKLDKSGLFYCPGCGFHEQH